MEKTEQSQNLVEFLNSGIYRFPDSDTVFIDPVRVLNRSYTRFTLSPSAYYSRFFHSQTLTNSISLNPKKRKRNNNNKKKKNQPFVLNEREQAAEKRHQEARPFLLKAHQSLLRARQLLSVLPTLRDENFTLTEEIKTMSPRSQLSFIELGQLWQAPLYEVTLEFPQYEKPTGDGGLQAVQKIERRTYSIFKNLVVNDSQRDVEAEFLTSHYILPKESCFYMSDLQQIYKLVPDPDCGFHLIVVDPPWENGSARQKLRYPTLPNRHFLSLPIKEFAHRDGALVALWVTNREKLRDFVEKELFPAWGVKYAATFFWLKVKADGSLICDLDLFHHKPYECLLLGFCEKEVVFGRSNAEIGHVKDKQVFISIPGDYSRKPPIEGLLLKHAPGLKPARCVELFARELKSGCLSWGNEPLFFQESIYFRKR